MKEEKKNLPAVKEKKRKHAFAKRPRRVSMNNKAAKLFKAHVIDGNNKRTAAKIAGIADERNVWNMEQTETYQVLKQNYADIIESEFSKIETVRELVKNVKQDSDRGAKNTALKMLMDRMEPQERAKNEEEKMIVVLRA